MNQMLDNIFSLVIGGILAVLMQALMLNMRSSATYQTGNTIVQSNLVTVTDIVENDFRKMGYALASAADSGIIYADTSKIVIKGDLDNNGVATDSIRYSLSSTAPPGNVNPRTRYLNRKWMNGSDQQMNIGVTKFLLSYYDSAGNKLTATPKVANPKKIKAIKITINLESIMPSEMTRFDSTYSYASWEEMFRPLNLK